MNEEIELLKNELSVINLVASEIIGIHTLVAKKCKISTVYSRQIRSGDNANLGKEKNIALIKLMIKHYRKELRKVDKKIKKVI